MSKVVVVEVVVVVVVVVVEEEERRRRRRRRRRQGKNNNTMMRMIPFSSSIRGLIGVDLNLIEEGGRIKLNLVIVTKDV